MTAISLKKQAPRQHRYEEEELLDNTYTILLKRAGLLTCLFFWLPSQLVAQVNNKWQQLSENLYQAHTNCLSLNLNDCRKLINGATTPEALYLSSLADALELLITEDRSKFADYELAHEKRVDALKKISPATPQSIFTLAELRLQWAFVYLKFGHDFSAARNVRLAHLAAQECRKKFPAFMPAQKTSGMLNVMLGSVPEKYQWILGLLGMKGSVDTGLAELEQVSKGREPLAFESSLLLFLIEGFMLQQTDTAVAGMEALHFRYPDNRLILFLAASLAIKNSMSEVALNMLEKVQALPDHGLPLHYADYLSGEVYLHQGNYNRSVQAYQSFIKNYKGENFVKDAHYKTAVAYWLNHRSELATKYFELAKSAGKQSGEADKYAARALAENAFPHSKLAKIRYSTDGGYYDEAFRMLESIRPEELITTKERTELNYRTARLYHKTGRIDQAKKYYLLTIEKGDPANGYFAPNGCLQLGYIYEAENNAEEARKYFNKALTYKNHAYKNSIDSKAKSALSKLKDMH
jgi:hypothetical protein